MRLICLQSTDREINNFAHPLIVGRADDADVQIVDRFVSRKHCVLESVNGQIAVRDLQSRHGTWVNGQQIESAHLQSGDILTIGLSKFRAVDPEDAVSADQAPAGIIPESTEGVAQ